MKIVNIKKEVNRVIKNKYKNHSIAFGTKQNADQFVKQIRKQGYRTGVIIHIMLWYISSWCRYANYNLFGNNIIKRSYSNNNNNKMKWYNNYIEFIEEEFPNYE